MAESTEAILKGALEGGVAGLLASYVVPSLAGQSDSSEEKSRPFYVGGGAFLGALRRILSERGAAPRVGYVAPWGGSDKPSNQGQGPASPCPAGMMWDVQNQTCVSEPLPWPIGPRTGLAHGPSFPGGEPLPHPVHGPSYPGPLPEPKHFRGPGFPGERTIRAGLDLDWSQLECPRPWLLEPIFDIYRRAGLGVWQGATSLPGTW